MQKKRDMIRTARNNYVLLSISCAIGFAGVPATIIYSSTSFVTTAPRH